MVERETRSRSVEVLESIVSAVIVLVIAQTFLEDFGALVGWSSRARTVLIFSGVAFDLFFTVEFITRLYGALSEGRARRYLFRERGWIDFVASVPLLMLSSGPVVLAYWAGAAGGAGALRAANLLKLVKVVRIARVLRLLRLLKLFRAIRYANSVMAQRHVGRVIAVSVTVVVAVAVGWSLEAGRIPGADAAAPFAARERRLLERVVADGASEATLAAAHALEPSLLMVRKGGTTLYSRLDAASYRRLFGPGDYSYRRSGDLEVFFDEREADRAVEQAQAQQGLLLLAIVLALIAASVLLYSPHFVLTVSDPLHVMVRGLSEPDYFLQVQIPRAYAGDEVFALARSYNESYLPAKDRARRRRRQEQRAGASDAGSLRIDDVKDLLGK